MWENLPFLIYFIDTIIADGSPLPGGEAVAMLLVIVIVGGIIFGESLIVYWSAIKKPFIIILSLLFVCVFLNSLIPTKETAYKMLAAAAVVDVSQTDGAKRIGDKTLQLVEATIDSYYKEMTDTVKPATKKD